MVVRSVSAVFRFPVSPFSVCRFGIALVLVCFLFWFCRFSQRFRGWGNTSSNSIVYDYYLWWLLLLLLLLLLVLPIFYSIISITYYLLLEFRFPFRGPGVSRGRSVKRKVYMIWYDIIYYTTIYDTIRYDTIRYDRIRYYDNILYYIMLYSRVLSPSLLQGARQ